MFTILFIFIVCFCIVMSLRTLFIPIALQDKFLSWENFIYLFFIFLTILIGFGLIYFILQENGLTVYIDHSETPKSFMTSLLTSFYFSGVTLFSIGYGDVSPIGIGRLLAILEGIIGYIIPASFVVRTVIDFRRERG